MNATATATNHNTLMHPDTFLGVCEAIGQDFGFNPLWLRLAFVPPVFFQPGYALVAYLALGAIVLASRLLFPPTSAADVEAGSPVIAAPVASPASAQVFDERLPLAA